MCVCNVQLLIMQNSQNETTFFTGKYICDGSNNKTRYPESNENNEENLENQSSSSSDC